MWCSASSRCLTRGTDGTVLRHRVGYTRSSALCMTLPSPVRTHPFGSDSILSLNTIWNETNRMSICFGEHQKNSYQSIYYLNLKILITIILIKYQINYILISRLSVWMDSFVKFHFGFDIEFVGQSDQSW